MTDVAHAIGLRLPRRRASLSGPRSLVYFLGLVVPVAVYLTFVGYPIVYNLYLSVQRWNGLSPTVTFVGLYNYRLLLSDPNFVAAFFNTVQWAAISLVIHVGLGLAVAIFLFSKTTFVPTLFRSLTFLPYTMSLVAVALMFSLVLSPGFGLLDQALQAVGLQFLSRAWLGDYHLTLYILILIDAWAYFGVPLMLFHAGLGNIDPELFEAARLDGANGWQMARYVTLPAVRPTILVVTMLSIIHSLRAFDLVAVLTRGGPAGGTDVLGYYMYDVSFQRNQFGYGAAVAIVLLVLSVGFALAYMRTVAKDTLDADA